MPDTCEFSFIIPQGAKILIEKDQKVDADQILASGKSEGKIVEFDLSKLLSISPKDAVKSLQITLGSEVKKGDIVAKSKGFLKKESNFISPIDGLIESISEKGILKIRTGQEDIEIKSPIAGLAKIDDDGKITVTSKAKKFEALEGFGKSACGDLLILNDEAILNLPPLAGKIVVYSNELPKAFIFKAEACGAIGYICPKFSKDSVLGDIIICIFTSDQIEEIKKSNNKKVQLSGEQKYLLIPND